MKKTAIITLAVILAATLVAGAIVYFRPHSLTDRIAENGSLCVTCTTIGVQDGAAHNGTRTWENITVTKDIRDLLDEHPFRRSLPFSDSGMTPREKLLVISVYEGGAPVDSVILSDSGELSAGGANYTMAGADGFIGELVKLLETTD